jgi:hypothetical protein
MKRGFLDGAFSPLMSADIQRSADFFQILLKADRAHPKTAVFG